MCSSPNLLDVATWIASTGAAATAIIAAIQLKASRADANYRLTIDLLGDLAKSLEAAMALDLPLVRASILSAYAKSAALSDDDQTFMRFLHSIELLADARAHGGVNKPMVDRFLKSLIRSDVFPLSFLTSLQSMLGDGEAYQNTRALLTHYKVV